MRQGASRHAHEKRGHDLYETPAMATRALLRVMGAELAGQVVWEPCAGRGAIARVLAPAGVRVVAQDLVAYPGADAGIVTPVDFLMERAAPEGCRLMVTNPPYRLANAFVRHGLALGCDVIVLLRLMAIEGAGRSDLMDHYCRVIYAGVERLPAMHREGWEGPKLDSGGVPFAWFVFSTIPRPAGEPIHLRRISWRDPAQVSGPGREAAR